MLQNGAVKVYAVDVGYGQLAWTLRCDKRVVNMERTNIRHVTAEQLQEPVAFFQRGCFLYFSQAYLSGRCRHHRAGGGRCLPCKAAV